LQAGKTHLGRVCFDEQEAELSNDADLHDMDDVESVETFCSKVLRVAPRAGESKGCLSDIYLLAFNTTVDLVAGAVGETLFVDDGEPGFARSDNAKAQAYARSVCRSKAGAEHFLNLCRAETEQMLREHAHVVRALAAELRAKRAMTGQEVDVCTARAVADKSIAEERARRSKWQCTVEYAGNFTAFDGAVAQ
jgi:hypothetical protein